jgi:tyrosyl-tRNA synthetase
MGRKETDDLSASQIFYPCMQCADIFFLKADICQLGMDQRKVNMLAREYCDVAEPKIKFKPVILSHREVTPFGCSRSPRQFKHAASTADMLAGLKEGQEKMSKSDPDSAIFMEDDAADVKRKIKQAYCPPGVVEGNPCLDWMHYIVFGMNDTVTIKRSEANGGNL